MNDHHPLLAAEVSYRQNVLIAEAEASRLSRQLRATGKRRAVPSRRLGAIPTTGWLPRLRLLIGTLTAR